MKPYYEDDLVTLYHGDCLEVAEWLDGDVLVTDPPYGVSWESGFTSYRKTTDRVISNTEPIKNDNSVEVRDLALEAWGSRAAIVFGTWKQPKPAGTEHRLIWHKAGMPPGPTNSAFMTQDEEIYIVGAGFKKTSPPMRSVIRTTEHRSLAVKVGHPTPKPVGLMELLIERCPDGTIVDPFAGSGATLIAARNLGRKAIGVELDEKYCELIASRSSQQAFDLGGLIA